MIAIRSCTGLEEFEACVDLEIETWGYDESELIPRKTFLLAQKIGGQVLGAFDSDLLDSRDSNPAKSLVGFAMSLPGVKSIAGRPTSYLHSHMLAARASHRNRGIGTQLKWKQRDEALSRGIRHMEWTFDPLEIKNAFLNIHKLGAVVREYRVDFYGVSSSRLQGGLPTDRLLAEWDLDSPRVVAASTRKPMPDCEAEVQVVVPASIDEWKSSESQRERALAVQLEIRTKFLNAFSRGLAVIGFSRDVTGDGVYALGSPASLNQVSSQDY